MKGGEYCFRCYGTLPLIFEDGEKAEIRKNSFYGCGCKSPKLYKGRKKEAEKW